MKSALRKLKQAKKKFWIASFLLSIVALVAVVFALIAMIAAMGIASIDDCNTSDSDVGAVQGRIDVNEKPKYGQTAMLHIAEAVSKKTGINERLLYAQLSQEAGANGDSPVAKADHNFGGMTYFAGATIGSKGMARPDVEGGNYIHYKNLSDFATEWAKLIAKNLKEMNLSKNTSIAKYSHAMKQKGYYTADEAKYTAGMEALAKNYDALKHGKKAQGDGNNGTDDSSNEACNSEEPAGTWGWPFKSIPKSGPGSTVSGEQLFGHSSSRKGGFHDGVDFGTSQYGNSYILAIHGGTVKKIGHEGYTQNDLGWYVWIESSDGYCEMYQEFAFAASDKDRIKVSVGDKVKVGDKIGYLKATGNVTHVHMGVTKEKDFNKAISKSFTNDGTWKDPIKIIKEGIPK
ncbi:Mannosyl-glycoprotein endo-beta-N-acetylglucosaminidase [Lactobacillus bombicola]|uniref:Mannosyl-glycoprotein endo-beta-N-acetylglucosaminidase n=1 Tax=Lactobacillus bombicola TaxID=1505723 RepID=A0A1I1TYA1_9LACO|nr:M23 family metallopeptidase [Lactobacillus bombicola]SFD62278.1 Mannosyl-glycoprotein endo-beta-N-acetylglucosaminidase [Lactobacillus bombicola]